MAVITNIKKVLHSKFFGSRHLFKITRIFRSQNVSKNPNLKDKL